MTPRRRYVVRAGAPGELTLPPELVRALGVAPGGEVEGEADDGSLRLSAVDVSTQEPPEQDWRAMLLALWEENARRGVPQLTDEELKRAIRRAAEDAATKRYLRSFQRE